MSLHIHCQWNPHIVWIGQGSLSSTELWQVTAAEDLPSLYHAGWYSKALRKWLLSMSSLHTRLFTNHLPRFLDPNCYRQKGIRREKLWHRACSFTFLQPFAQRRPPKTYTVKQKSKPMQLCELQLSSSLTAGHCLSPAVLGLR